MPSKSKSQQRFFGMVDAYKKGEMKNASSKIKKAAKGMSMSDVKDFAETKHKGLPEKVEEQVIIRLTESDLHKIVKESVKKVLEETYNSDLYHFTNLEGIYGILESNSLSLMLTGDDEYDDNSEAVCLSRTRNPYIGYCPDTEYDLIFRITLDTNKMSSSIRGMKIKPWSMNNPRTTVSYWQGKKRFLSVSDYEERAYENIDPLDKYCKKIDVFPLIRGEEFDEEQIKILNKIKKDFPQWNSYFNW